MDKAWDEAIKAVRKEKAGVDTRNATQRIADLRLRKNFNAVEETAADRRKNTRDKMAAMKSTPPSGALNLQGGNRQGWNVTCPVQKEAAHGHTLWIGGVEPRAWIWC